MNIHSIAGPSTQETPSTTPAKVRFTVRHKATYDKFLADGYGHPALTPNDFKMTSKEAAKLVKQNESTLKPFIIKHCGEPSTTAKMLGVFPFQHPWGSQLKKFLGIYQQPLLMPGTGDIYLGKILEPNADPVGAVLLKIDINQPTKKIKSIDTVPEAEAPNKTEMLFRRMVNYIENKFDKEDVTGQESRLQFLLRRGVFKELPEAVCEHFLVRLLETQSDTFPPSFQKHRDAAEVELWKLTTVNKTTVEQIDKCVKDTSITTLNLSREWGIHKLSYLPAGIFNDLTHVTVAKLRRNLFTQLPPGLDKLTNLEELDLGGNPSSIVDGFASSFSWDAFPKLKKIWLDRMYIMTEEAAQLKEAGQKRGIEIVITKSRVVDRSTFIEQELEQAEAEAAEWKVTKATIRTLLRTDACAEDASKTTLDLSIDNKTIHCVSYVPTDVFTDLTHVTVADFKWCLFKQIPSGLAKLTHLQELNLKENPISDTNVLAAIPNWDALPNLTKISFEMCELRQFPLGLEKLTQLQELNLDKNPFSPHDGFATLPNWDALPNLKKLSLKQLFINKEDAARLKAIAEQRGIEIAITDENVIDPSNFIPRTYRFVPLMIKHIVSHAREHNAPVSVVGIRLYRAKDFLRTGKMVEIKQHFFDFLKKNLMKERSDLKPIFTEHFDRDHYKKDYRLVMLKMSRADTRKVLGELRQEFKNQPFMEEGDPLALPFIAGVVEYRPGDDPKLDAMESDDVALPLIHKLEEKLARAANGPPHKLIEAE